MVDDDFPALCGAVLGDLALLSDSAAAERVQRLLHCAQQRAENTLDRAALLCEDGLISTVTVAPLLIQPQTTGPAPTSPSKRRPAVGEEEFRRA
ncbi:MAG: hypothetical protein ACI8S6_005856 [Myxococcota bacterium]|jgi:hypothetical protein